MRCLQNKPFCIYGLPFYGLGAVGRVLRNSALKGRAKQSKSFLRQPGSLLAFLGGQAEQRVGDAPWCDAAGTSLFGSTSL